MTAAWKVDDATIFRHHAVDYMKVTGNPTELVQNATGHEHDLDTACTRYGDCIAHGRIQTVVARDGSVIVKREY
jgi:hypothetical protein